MLLYASDIHFSSHSRKPKKKTMASFIVTSLTLVTSQVPTGDAVWQMNLSTIIMPVSIQFN